MQLLGVVVDDSVDDHRESAIAAADHSQSWVDWESEQAAVALPLYEPPSLFKRVLGARVLLANARTTLAFFAARRVSLAFVDGHRFASERRCVQLVCAWMAQHAGALSVHVFNTPRQLHDSTRRFIRDERHAMLDAFAAAGQAVRVRDLMLDERPSLRMHFDALAQFRLLDD